MKRIIQAFIVLLIFTAFTVAATAADIPSVERGMSLFSSTLLGTNGKSCSVCHARGKGLEGVAAYDEITLEKIVNQCIEKSLKGKALATGSPELSSLVMYLKTLGPAKEK